MFKMSAFTNTVYSSGIVGLFAGIILCILFCEWCNLWKLHFAQHINAMHVKID